MFGKMKANWKHYVAFMLLLLLLMAGESIFEALLSFLK